MNILMRNILMLDIDGVLNIISNSYATAKHQDNLVEAHLVERLNYLCRKIDILEIVISSSWRRCKKSKNIIQQW